jgi:hypothetical protein
MPKLSMWNSKKTNNYRFFDRNIREQFNVGGVGVIVHKYLGPEEGQVKDEATLPQHQNENQINETSIQDLLFLENRDRKYDRDLYGLRGVYNVSDNDFDLTQFGLFLTNDTLYMTFHLNEMVEIIGRKLMSGDVVELPHLLEEYGLDADKDPLPKFYAVEDGNRGGEGFSATWWSHIWRVKLSPITDSQEFDDILGEANDDGSLKNMLSTFGRELDIRDAVVEDAANRDPQGGGHTLTEHLYNHIEETPSNYYDVQNVAPGQAQTIDGIEAGGSFPLEPNVNDFFIRTDFKPQRLFVYRGTKWIRLYDNISDVTWSNRTFNAATFINNVAEDTANDRTYDSRQNIKDVIKPQADYDGNTGLDK